MQTQWNVGMSGLIGLRYESLKVVCDALNLTLDAFMLSDVNVMEIAALKHVRDSK